MWLIDEPAFLSVPNDSKKKGKTIIHELYSERKNLTFVIGNGLSRAAVFEVNSGSEEPKAESWDEVVGRAFKRFHNEDPPKEANNLVVAQAVCNKDGGRKWLLKNLATAFKSVPTSALHRGISDQVRPRYIVTTNYDPLIEKAFKTGECECYVRDSWKRKDKPERRTTRTLIFKMHGALPFNSHSSVNVFQEPQEPEDTVVISENDYDDCVDELVHFQTGLFWEALNNTLLILGKGVWWEDLSFMRALRERNGRTTRPAYWLLPSSNWYDDNVRLTLENLGVTPLLMDLPNQKTDEIYYFAYRKALERIFKVEVKLKSRLERLRDSLISYPSVVAIGLCAQNSVGQSGWPAGRIPPAGRRNLTFENFHEYAGGSALTAVSVCKALCESIAKNPSGADRCALVSIVGKDEAGKVVSRFCKGHGVDDDAVAIVKELKTPHSVVVVHRLRSKNSTYGGQRMFFDVHAQSVAGNKVTDLTTDGIRQLEAMLSLKNKKLRVVYLDRWFAVSKKAARREREYLPGFLSLPKRRKLLNKVARRPNVDMVYETGGQGTNELMVEQDLSPLINIMTAAFPFFWKRIYSGEDRSERLDFQVENSNITQVLNINGLKHGSWVRVPFVWRKNANAFLRRQVRRKWLIVTLHDHGALAFHLTKGRTPKMKYFEAAPGKLAKIRNTTGAGDTFRGAFLFALLNVSPGLKNDRNKLACCTAFAVKCATERCRKFKMEDVLKQFKKKGNEWWRRTTA